MSFLSKFLNRSDPREKLAPLYAAIVAAARQPHWYIAGGVPDTREGRFDMVAALLSLTLLRLERAPEHAQDSAYLTEIFVEDMDGQLRQIGIGDMIVGKHIGRIMGALGGRLGAYRAALNGGDSWEAVVTRNIWGGVEPDPAMRDHVVRKFKDFVANLDATTPDAIAAGKIPDTGAEAHP